MDLRLYLRVVRRFRVLVAAGLALAIVLAVLATARVSFEGGKPKLVYRQAQVFRAETTLFVTQNGFPWGSTVPQYLPTDSTTGNPATPEADPNRLATLTTLYAQLAKSDPVNRLLRARRAPAGTVAVDVVPAPAYASPAILPLLTLSATGPSPTDTVRLANLASETFRGWLYQKQVLAAIPPEQRVAVQVIHRAEGAVIVSGRSKTMPVVVFLTVLAATMGLIFVLENMRPPARAVPSGGISATERRSA